VIPKICSREHQNDELVKIVSGIEEYTLMPKDSFFPTEAHALGGGGRETPETDTLINK